MGSVNPHGTPMVVRVRTMDRPIPIPRHLLHPPLSLFVFRSYPTLYYPLPMIPRVDRSTYPTPSPQSIVPKHSKECYRPSFPSPIRHVSHSNPKKPRRKSLL